MQAPEEFSRWLEAGIAALAGLGAWIWRVAVKYQSLDDRLNRLEEDTADERRKRDRHDAELSSTLEELKIGLAVQGTQISNIEKTCAATNKAVVEILADRMPGGGRKNDPPIRREETT